MQKIPGVLNVFTIDDIEKVCSPWQGVLGHLGEMRSQLNTSRKRYC